MTAPVDLEELKRLLKKADHTGYVQDSMECDDALHNAAPALIAELEAARKDAARYRWWKLHITPENPAMWAHYLGDWETYGLDAAIDASRKESA